MRVSVRCAIALVSAVVSLASLESPASAQEEAPIGQVDIGFDVGDFDDEVGDWTIEAVEVTGDLDEGEPFTVEVLGAGDEVLFTATQPYSNPSTRIEVTSTVAVADVAGAGVSQPLTIVGGTVIERPEVDWAASGGGGSGQLALSMVMAVIVVAIVFRTPLPSASTQRWTK